MSEPASPIPDAVPSASTVMLRQGIDTIDLLMVKRRAGDAFGESYAFPGGLVDANETDSHQHAIGRTADEVNQMLDVPDGLSYYSAAIRELFEETGILLIEENEVAPLADLQNYRRKVDCGQLPWADFLQQHSVRMNVGALHYFTWWETPFTLPKRWSTRFFLALMPANQAATLDSNELTDIRWMPASEILINARNGEMKLPFPTMRILEDLSQHSTIDKTVAWADQRALKRIEKLRPSKIIVNGETKWVFNDDPEFPLDRQH